MSEIRYIAIEGVIGAGKTSLANKLAERTKANLILEEFETNPFLAKFYDDRKRYAFQTQMFFLVNRFKQQQELNQDDLFSEFIVSDYIFDKDNIFAYMNLSGDELKLYEALFPQLQRDLRKPDLVIYLQASSDRLMYNIKKRNRKFEKNITLRKLPVNIEIGGRIGTMASIAEFIFKTDIVYYYTIGVNALNFLN